MINYQVLTEAIRLAREQERQEAIAEWFKLYEYDKHKYHNDSFVQKQTAKEQENTVDFLPSDKTSDTPVLKQYNQYVLATTPVVIANKTTQKPDFT